MIQRRALVVGGIAVLGTLTESLAARAQPARKIYRIGILGNFEASDAAGSQPRNPSTSAFLRGMRDLGYVYGDHFVTEPRGSGGNPSRFASLAAELVRLQADVIVSGPALPALKQATSTIPIVMAAAGDPVGSGYVQSLGHPGRNFTGLSLQSVETTAKRLEMVNQLVPGVAPVAFIWEPSSFLYWQAAEAAAQARGWKLLSLEVRDAGAIQGAFRAATDAHAGALVVSGAGVLFPQARRVAELAAKHRLPAMYELRAYVEAGGLIAYGPDIIDMWRRAAGYVDKILKGARPADLPVEQPTKFELVINLKTAKALSLTIPPSVLARADEVIQ